MSNAEEIIRLAAKGDGVTASGHHVSGALPGDMVSGERISAFGPHHVTPPCEHFGACGGCHLQQADEDTLDQFVQDRVLKTARGQGLEPLAVLDVHLSPPRSRRRATLHAMRTQRGAILGFREARSHRIVDLADCHILHPSLASLGTPLRELIARFGGRGAIDIHVTLCDQGVDVSLTNMAFEGLEGAEAAPEFARDQALARLSVDCGYGPETLWEPEPATVTRSGVSVGLPAVAFLQATQDAEAMMIDDAQSWLDGAGLTADLFSGLGTFAFALREGRKVLAVEADQAAHLASKAAASRTGGKVHVLHRDLFRAPLQTNELANFDAALLDPPRAGAKSQVAELAQSKVGRIVYVSCNPSSWARDAATLANGGYRLKKLRPVGQFRWSTHVELVSLFER